MRDYTIDYPLTGSGDGITIDPYFGKKIAGGFYVSGEASYIEYIGGYYYLFVTYGGLAAGGVPTDYNNGGYQMRVFRSENPDGPFIDSRNNSAVFSSYLLNFGDMIATAIIMTIVPAKEMTILKNPLCHPININITNSAATAANNLFISIPYTLPH